MTVRVIYIGHTAAVSGAEISLLRLLAALPDEVEPSVVLGADGPLVARVQALGVPVEVLELPRATSDVVRTDVGRGPPLRAVAGAGAMTLRLARLLRSRRPDIVHTNSMKAHLYGGAAARLAGVPHVWHARDRASADYLSSRTAVLVRAAARTLPAAVVANSHATLATHGRVRRGRVVHNAAPPHQRRQPAPTAPPLHVGVVGRLTPWKGQEVFLRAFADAFGDGDAQGHVVGGALFGEDAYAARLEELAAELGVADRVRFTGHVDDVGAVLDRLHVLVHCSTTPEPFGQVVVEGMKAGLAVVAADAGGPAEIVEDGVSGILVPPGDPAALAAALRRLRDDPGLRSRLGEGGIARGERFSPEHVARGVLDVYRELLGQA